MNITLVCVGKLTEKYWKEAVAEYSKRLSKYCKLKIIEVGEGLCYRQNNTQALNTETKNILANIKIPVGAAISRPSSYIILLDIHGTKLTSEALAEKINNLAIDGKSDITFIIGGSEGVADEVKKCANFSLSFSDMTYPHQMMRVVLLEQIYRSFKIIKNETYHK